ncbi:MlaD family protein [Azotobacter chroococcum]
MSLRLFVHAPYDRFVTDNSRFWNASGLDVKLGAGGIEVDTQSMVSILLGGVAFETPPESAASPAAAADTRFELFADRARAMRNPERDVLKMVLFFDESLRGLEVGAPVDFQGITLGEVSAIRVELDHVSRRIVMPVEVNLYPERLRLRSRESTLPRFEGEARKRFLEELVATGLRAQLRSGNLLTGQLYVSLDVFPRRARPRSTGKAIHRNCPPRSAAWANCRPPCSASPAGWKSCRWSRSAPTCGRPCRPPVAC